MALQQASGTDRALAAQYGIGLSTVRKWRKRESLHDASHTPHRLQTTLNAGQEELVICLRTQLMLPLDDLLAVVHEFIEPRKLPPSPRFAQDPSLVALGEAIKRMRKDRQVSQEELAHLGGLDRSYLSNLERGMQNPGILVITSIASALQMKAAELLQEANL